MNWLVTYLMWAGSGVIAGALSCALIFYRDDEVTFGHIIGFFLFGLVLGPICFLFVIAILWFNLVRSGFFDRAAFKHKRSKP